MNIQDRSSPPVSGTRSSRPRPPVWLLVAMIGIGPFTLQIIVPSLPGIGRALEASAGVTQLAVTLYLVGIAAGQLVYGPLSDRFGRRPLLLGGMAVYAAASLAAAAAPTVGWLILARIGQSLGACAGVVLARAVIRDVWPREEAASVLGYVTMGMTIAPMLAPIMGSLLEENLGWRAIMLACLGFGLPLALAAFLRLPETLPAPQPLPGVQAILSAYRSLFALPAFRAYAAITYFSSGVFFAFIGGAPHVVVQGMGYSPTVFALAFAAMSVLFAFGNFLAGWLSMRLGVVRMLTIGCVVTTLGAVASAIALILFPGNVLDFFLPMSLVAMGNGMTQPNAIAGALSARPQLAGTASALVGAMQMAFGALMTVIVGVAEDGSGLATTIAMAAAGIGAQIALRGVRREG